MLKSLLETKKYTEIIKQVNYIIQDEIYKEKYGKTPEKDFWLRSLIILMIVTMFIIILNIIKLSEGK